MSLFRALGIAPKPKKKRDPAKAEYRGETEGERAQIEDQKLASKYAREQRALEEYILARPYGSTVVHMMRAEPARAIELAPILADLMADEPADLRWAAYRMIAKRFPIDDSLIDETILTEQLKKAMRL